MNFRLEDGGNFTDFFAIDLIERANLLTIPVRTSFLKKRNNFWIISAIIDNFETKISYYPNIGKLKSSCNCKEWSAVNHCVHAVILYGHLQQDIPGSVELVATCPKEFGTVIWNPDDLLAQNYGDVSFSSLTYKLVNGNYVVFPVPREFREKLRINIDQENNYQYRFSYLENYQVSILANLYIFDWKNGITYFIPDDLKYFLKKISSSKMEHILQLFSDIRNSKYSELYIDHKAIEVIPRSKARIRLSFTKGDNDTFLGLSFVDRYIINPPLFLSMFDYDKGPFSRLGSRLKIYKQITQLLNYFKKGSSFYGKFDDDRQNAFMEDLAQENFYSYDNGKVFVFNTGELKDFFLMLSESFGPIVFKNCILKDKQLCFFISNHQLLEKIGRIYQKNKDIIIHFNDQELSTWKPELTITRDFKKIDWFDLTADMNLEDLAVIKNYRGFHNLVETKQGVFLLDAKQKNLLFMLKKYTGEIKKKDDKKVEISFNLNRSRIFELFELMNLGLGNLLTESELSVCEKLANLKELPSYNIPSTLQSILRGYQVIGFNWINFLYEHRMGGCLADDMGLGKTLQAIAFIESIYDKVERILIICPVSLLLNWAYEFKKFTNLEVEIYHGASRDSSFNKKIILTSYGLMRKEALSVLGNHELDVLILDESQILKNVRSLGSQAVRKLKSKFTLCLTGTPVENDLSEFYNIMDISIPGVWGDLKILQMKDHKQLRLDVRNRAKPFVLRRKKSEVLTELPPKTEQYVYLNFNAEERRLYDQELRTIRDGLKEHKLFLGDILKNLLHLRLLCLRQSGNNGLVYFNNKMIASTKLSFLIDRLLQLKKEGYQSIIFSQFTSYLDIIEKLFKEKNISYARVDGGQTIKRRQKEIDLFQQGERKNILISLKAGGLGLNLTAASYVFILDPWWNPALERQAIDRAHRIGQLNSITVYRPIIKNSVEEKVLELQKRKQELFNDLLAEDEIGYFSGKLTLEDFKNILN